MLHSRTDNIEQRMIGIEGILSFEFILTESRSSILRISCRNYRAILIEENIRQYRDGSSRCHYLFGEYRLIGQLAAGSDSSYSDCKAERTWCEIHFGRRSRTDIEFKRERSANC